MKITVLFVCLVIGVTMGARLKRAGGGTEIKFERAPYFASIRRRGLHVCNGAFISTQHVLTAANCVLNESFRNYHNTTVLSGTDINRRNDAGQGIKKISPHEGFLKGLFWCNIAVITLSAHAEWSDKLQAIALPDAEPPYTMFATLIAFKARTSHLETTALRSFILKIKNPEPAAEMPRNLDPTFYGRVVRNKYTKGATGYGKIYKRDRGAPLVLEEKIVGIVATTSPTNLHACFFVNVFACKTFIIESMGQIASSSSELTSETSSPAKRRRLNP